MRWHLIRSRTQLTKQWPKGRRTNLTFMIIETISDFIFNAMHCYANPSQTQMRTMFEASSSINNYFRCVFHRFHLLRMPFSLYISISLFVRSVPTLQLQICTSLWSIKSKIWYSTEDTPHLALCNLSTFHLRLLYLTDALSLSAIPWQQSNIKVFYVAKQTLCVYIAVCIKFCQTLAVSM